MINRTILVGRLTKDVELKVTASGTPVVSFTLAVNRRVSKNATTQPTADFIQCVAWNQTAELMNTYLHRGSQIGVEGRIQTRNYDDPNIVGKKVYVTEVVVETVTFLETKQQTSQQETYSYIPEQVEPEVIDTGFDDLPF